VQCSDLQSRLLRSEADVERLRAAEAFLKEQAAGLEAALMDKNRALDQMQKQVAALAPAYDMALSTAQQSTYIVACVSIHTVGVG
jgi:predicted O-methyltransferase YrrM